MCASMLFASACTGSPSSQGEQTKDVSANTQTAGTDSGASTEAGQTTAETEEIPQDDGKITVVAAGDNLVHEAVYTFAQTLASRNTDYTGKYYFDPMYDDIKPIVQQADLAIINQESQVCPGYSASGYPDFATPESMGTALINTGFDVIVTANNHMLDNGDDALVTTYNYWKDKPVIQVGIDMSADEGMDIAVFEQDGVKIALLAYTDVVNGGSSAVKKSKYAKYTYYDFDIAKKQINKAKEVADLVFVSMHWGKEDSFKPNSAQKEIANQLAGLGVDVIIGHHSHVIQPIEWIETDEGKTLCIYSLGNFLSTMLNSYHMVGLMVSFDVITNDGEPYIDNVVVIPTVTNYVNSPSGKLKDRKDVAVYLMENYTEEMVKNHGCNSNDPSPVTMALMKSYVTDNIAKEFLPDFLK